MIINSINLSFFAFPASLILAILYVVLLWMLVHYYAHTWLFRFLSNMKTAVVSSALVVLFLLADGTWGLHLYASWYFVPVALVFMSTLGVTAIRRCYNRPNVGFLLNHFGLFIICWSMFFGAPDFLELRMLAQQDQKSHLAYTAKGETMPLPFTVELKKFQVDYYPDGLTPRQYTSTIMVDGQEHSLSVNHPLHYKGYTLYQNSYDKERGNYSVLQLVYDPWLWGVWVGIALLALGALIMIFQKR